MKCIQKIGSGEWIIRVPDDEGTRLVATGTWKYVPKWAWRASNDAQKIIEGGQ